MGLVGGDFHFRLSYYIGLSLLGTPNDVLEGRNPCVSF